MLAEASNVSNATVVAALQRASAVTGSDFHYLLGTAMRESGLKPGAQSSTSSAAGLFQFVEQTWFSVVKEYGAKHGSPLTPTRSSRAPTASCAPTIAPTAKPFWRCATIRKSAR